MIHYIIETALAGCIVASWWTHMRTASIIDKIEGELTYLQSNISHVTAPAADPRK